MKIDGYRENRKKNHWRRWQWNRIVEKLEENGIKPKDAIVVYLAGKENADLPEAERRGFCKENMIAVDISTGVIDHLRKNGTICLKSKLSDAIFAWKGTPKIDVVVADFCSGIMQEQVDFINSILFSDGIKTKKTVISVNLQRGRDKRFSDCIKEENRIIGVGFDTKHRGVGFVSALHGLMWSIVPSLRKTGLVDASKYLHTRKIIEKILKPSYSSYKSGKCLYFDSVVFTALSFPIYVREKCEYLKTFTNIGRKISAAKAIRTSRIQQRG